MFRIRPFFKSAAGVTLMETVVAVGVTVSSLMAYSASVQEATRVARSGKSFASATEMLQQRIEAFRLTSSWANVTTAGGIATVTAAASPIAVNFPGVTETFTVQPFPSGTALVVTRSANGTFTNNNVTLPASTNCVRFTATATWTAVGNAPRSRQISTIITRGGL